MRFREFVNPASQQKKQKIQKWIASVKQAADFLLRLTAIYNIYESKWAIKQEAEEYILPNKKFRHWMGSEPTWQGVYGYRHSCGKDGCAYFFKKNLVCKFTIDYREATAANAVKGKLRSVPVIDVAEIEIKVKEEITYAIKMEELKTDVYAMSATVKYGADIIADKLHQIMDMVDEDPDIPVDDIETMMSLEEDEEWQYNEDVLDVVYDLLQAAKMIYQGSGIVVGADWKSHNIGVSSQGTPQPFDFGRPQIHSRAYDSMQQNPMTILVI